MSTLRLSLVGMVMFMLLGGVGGAVVAQDEGSKAPARVTGQFVVDRQTYEANAPTFTDGRSRYNWWAEMDVSSSDPRLVGIASTNENIDDVSAFDDTKLFAATLAIANDAGTWEGDFTGFLTMEGLGTGYALLEGTGAYDGLSAFLSVEDPHDSRRFEGLVFKGTVPPVPPAE